MEVINKDIITVAAKTGDLTLQVRSEDGSVKTMHSTYDPAAEAVRLVDSFQFDGRGILVVLGLGLGYHVKELSRRCPNTDIIVVESEPEIYKLALDQDPELNDRIECVVGLSQSEVLGRISKCQMKDGMSPLTVFTLAPAVSIFKDYYSPILTSLNKIMSVRLWERLNYPKFKKDVLNIALIDSGYFLVHEVEKALKSIGHRVLKVKVGNSTESDSMISRFIETILDSKPDLVLTVNHLGFDEDGVLTSFFKSIEMPVASWYVDSPRIILQAFDKNISPYVSLFLWDKGYIEQIKNTGYESVNYLPLAADVEIFKPIQLKQSDIRKYRTDVTFVGNSLVDSTREKMEKVPAKLHPLVDKAACLLDDTRGTFRDVVNEMDKDEIQEYQGLSIRQRLDFESAVLWKATLAYRLSCVEKLKNNDHYIYGDSGWKELLDNNDRIRLPLHYYNELPVLYNACSINFNATHFQMGQAVNQRVFDVPACGAFLLTDRQESLDELFDAGKEIITYRQKNEIPELVKFYLKNPEKREAVSKRGRERVLREHTYKHRLKSLIGSMRARYS
jgi:spore maturation protein CgeB